MWSRARLKRRFDAWLRRLLERIRPEFQQRVALACGHSVDMGSGRRRGDSRGHGICIWRIGERGGGGLVARHWNFTVVRWCRGVRSCGAQCASRAARWNLGLHARLAH